MGLWSRLRGLVGGGARSPDVPAELRPAPRTAPRHPAEEDLLELADPSLPVDPTTVRKAVAQLRKDGLEQRALELLGDGLRARPADESLVSALAEAHVARLDFDSAVPLLERLVGSSAHGTRAELLLAEAAERRGELDRALAHYERVLARDLGHGQARARAERLRGQLGRRVASAQPTLVQPEGVQARGRYRLERELGRGGAGAVYLASDGQLGRQVALKVYHPQVLRGPDGPCQLAREAALPGRLGHPGLVQVFDLDRELGAIAMELLGGGSLKDLLRARGPLRPAEALELIERVCRPLAVLHEAGIVHRDFKPANVLARADGSLVLTDLGAALLPGEEHVPGLGTPAYMAPEQRSETALDVRADLYALGVTLAELLGGYPGPPGRVRELLDHCLCESPGGRPRDASELGRLARAIRLAEETPPSFAEDRRALSRLIG